AGDDPLRAQVFDIFHLETKGNGVTGHGRRRTKVLGAKADDEFGELGQVHRRGTEKSSDEGIRGVVVDFGRRAELVDNAFIEHQDAVAHGHGFHLIVRDVDRGSADAAVKALELLARGGAQFGVKIRERLVEQEHGGLADDRAGKRDPLAFATGELARLALEKCTYSEQRSRPLDFLLVELFFDLLSLQRKRYILVDRQVRVERVALEDHGDAAFARRKVVDHAAANEDVAGRGRFQSGDHAQQCGLPGAGWAEKDQKLAFASFQVHAVYGSESSCLENLCQIPSLNNSHQTPVASFPSRKHA